MTKKETEIKNKHIDDLASICYDLGFTIDQYKTTKNNIKSIADSILQLYFKGNNNIGFYKEYYNTIFNKFNDSVFQYCIFSEVRKHLVFCN